MIKKYFFNLTDHKNGEMVHACVMFAVLFTWLVVGWYWVYSPIIGLIIHCIYIKLYKHYKKEWYKREEIINNLSLDSIEEGESCEIR
jgi:phosphate/sulfate permease